MKKSSKNYSAKIKVVGIGGGGGNAISRMKKNICVRTIEFIAINTDAQDLDYCDVSKKIYIGKNLTRGLGTGMNPELGQQAAEENRAEISEALQGADLIFVTVGLGGGTGSGGVAVVAEVAKELGALTIAVVTRPFSFEGAQRSRIAQDALLKLKEKVDALITVPNDRIFNFIQKDTPLIKAFEYIDDVLRYAVEGIAELIVMPGIVNVDFADVKTIMQNTGSALIGIGIKSGQNRALNAVQEAINSPLLEVSIDGAKGILFGVSSRDLKMSEVHEIAKVITESIDSSAKIIFGAYHDRKLPRGQLKVTLIATGFNGLHMKGREASLPDLFSANIEMPKEEKKASIIAVQKKEKPEIKKKTTDAWDVPTFLRKKKK
jgi:cell division protein FtsZ